MTPIPVVILQYGKLDLTKACIESIRKQTVPVHVFLVDGCSPGVEKKELDELAALSDQYLFLNKNLGYAGANNKALQELVDAKKYEYVFILNNDTVVEPDCLANLLTVFQHHPQTAQVCPQVFYPSGALQSVGGKIRRDIFEPQLLGHLENPAEFVTAEKVDFAPGAAMLVRMSAIEKVGLLPEEYFLYSEDVDWSFQFIKAGWEVWSCPEARVVHYESASSGAFSATKAFYLTKSHVLLAKRWLSEEEWTKFLRTFRAKLFRQSIKRFTKPAYVQGMWRGFAAGLKEVHG